jgi:hypothetical protein
MTLFIAFINIVGASQRVLENVWQISSIWLWRLLFFSKQVVPRKSSARPLSKIARLQYNDITTPELGRVTRSLPRLLFMRC